MRKLLIYDASCPMCRVYTKGMVAADHKGHLSRMSNEQLIDQKMLNQLDRQRVRHEIPMIDLDGGKTYGLSGTFGWIVTLITAQLAIAALYLRLNKPDNFSETFLDYSGHLLMSLLIGGLFLKMGQLTNWAVLNPVGYALLIGQHFLRTYRLGFNPWFGIGFTALVFQLLRPL